MADVQEQQYPVRRSLSIGLLLLGCTVVLWFAPPYFHAWRLLAALQSGNSRTVLTRDLVLPVGDSGTTQARMYLPAAPEHAPVLVVVPGVHHLGIQEPRLQAFARGLATEGVLVITPEIPGVEDYRITPSDIDVIGESVVATQTLTGARQVGIMGLSFSGGLSLMAAAKTQYSPSIHYVIAVGSHDFMEHVAQFFGSGRMIEPDGTDRPFVPHDYGPMVMVYAHPEDYFPADQTAAVRAVLKRYLYEDVAGAEAALPLVAEPTRTTLKHWIEHHREALGAQILQNATKRSSEMERVSPHGHLVGLRAHVLLLHGAGDNIIPPSETEFLAKEVPGRLLDAELVSKAVSHVEVTNPKLSDKLKLLHWMAAMFERIDDGATRANMK